MDYFDCFFTVVDEVDEVLGVGPEAREDREEFPESGK